MALVLQRPKKLVGGVAAVALVAAMGVAGVAGAGTAVYAGPPEHAPNAVSGDLSRIDSWGTQDPQQPPGQAGAPGAQDPAQQQGEPQQGDPAQQAAVAPPPAVPQELLTPEERAALALVEQIIRDQEGVLMGTGFSYDRSGRRDPFMNLLTLRDPTTTPVDGRCPPGRLEGFLISEVVVKAIASAQGRRHAMITGPNQKAYFLEVGTELCDGHVSEITPTQVFFEQMVQDMTGARRSREVQKSLTTESGGGQTP